MTTHTSENRLALEPSAYLRQHAKHPVDWFPWGPEALARARELDRPIFLSIGYAACHWCHVMAHECFGDAEVADLLNADYVPIKVDREERPDLDAIYMEACQLISGRGGWPLTALLTPDLKPFFAGTYFPKHSRQGMPGLLDLLTQTTQYWNLKRDEVETVGSELVATLASRQAGNPPGDLLSEGTLAHAEEVLQQQFDDNYGGFGGAPKFLVPHTVQFMLQRGVVAGGSESLQQAKFTLDQMLAGGVHDQLGGGFHRYATDARWRVPHFEKMLYDQALMVQLLCDAHQAFGGRNYEKAIRKTVGFVLAELRAPDGAFYSSLDADSEGEEGRYYTWTLDQVAQAVGPELFPFACDAYGLDLLQGGVEQSHYTLQCHPDLEALGRMWGLRLPDTEEKVEQIRLGLLEARNRRPRPGTDDKLLTDWNGLMIGALARAGRVLGDPAYVDAAKAALGALMVDRLTADGDLIHARGSNGRPIDGMLDDYAFLTWAILELSQSGDQGTLLPLARTLFERSQYHFQPTPSQGFYLTRGDVPDLLIRQMHLFDGALPSGNSIQLLNSHLLQRLTGDGAYANASDALQKACSVQVAQAPWAHTAFLLGVMR